MVQVSRFLRAFTCNAVIVGLVGLFIIGHIFVKIVELSISKKSNCTYQEPIDVVYTWVNGSDSRFLQNMYKYLKIRKENIDYSKQRFEDKNELRFSLRSLEKFAPWVNHVYLVTNGQIPYWLNLDYEKITIVTHEEIFKDKDNLPSFSSPAIESNIYRIPGLTKKFVYFNDDIFIGQPLYIDDFYATSKGYMVFLDYSLPGCTKNCPWLYVGDGQCDRSCNIPNCQFDGGDCVDKEDKQVIYADDNHSKETESYNERVNKEFEIVKHKVEEMFVSGHTKKTININSNTIRYRGNDSSIFSRNDTVAKDILIDNNKTDGQQNSDSRVSLNVHKRNVNVSISKLVQEHNEKVLVANKKLSRKRRYIHKENTKSKKKASIKYVNGYFESLMYTQRLLNRKFGYKARYVPAHAPILVDRDIMQSLQDTFPTEFELMERNRFRNDNDVQFSFSYYYFLMSDKIQRTKEEVFDEFDTDGSGTWSDREIRNLLTKIYELPLSYEMVDHFEGILLNCSELQKYPIVTPPPYERYIDSRLPTISKDMVTKCPFLSEYLNEKFGQVPKYKYQIVKGADSRYFEFRMLTSNISLVVKDLDEIRRGMTKFICLNDNLHEYSYRENELVKAILYDFYLSLFPHPSKFELPEYSRNRFLYMDELNDWKQQHFILKIILGFGVMIMVFLKFSCVFKKCCCKIFNDLCC